MSAATLAEAVAQRDELLARTKALALQVIATFTDEELEAALAALRMAESAGWMLDPTAYRTSREARARVAELYQATLRYRRAVVAMFNEDIARAAPPTEAP